MTQSWPRPERFVKPETAALTHLLKGIVSTRNTGLWNEGGELQNEAKVEGKARSDGIQDQQGNALKTKEGRPEPPPFLNRSLTQIPGGTFGFAGLVRLWFPSYSESGIGKQVHSP